MAVDADMDILWKTLLHHFPLTNDTSDTLAYTSDFGASLDPSFTASTEEPEISGECEEPEFNSEFEFSPPAKSSLEPILSQPTVIRFPSAKGAATGSSCLCHWSKCTDPIYSSSKLVEHLQSKHIASQAKNDSFVCLWEGCKVYNKSSSSHTWLERHVLSHAGNKPFKCIVDNCGQRFTSQFLLQRHVNQHFNEQSKLNQRTDVKLIRRNGQKLRYRREPYSARKTDIFDTGVMSQLQYLLVKMAQSCEQVSVDVMNTNRFLNINFQPKVIGSCTGTRGKKKYLVRWYPYNALNDEWVSAVDLKKPRCIPIWKLPQSAQEPFWNAVFPNRRPRPKHGSRKFKKTEESF